MLAQVPAKQVPLVVLAGFWLVLLSGLVLMVVVVAGARYVRRLNRQPPRPSQMISDRWYEKPLVDALAEPARLADAEHRRHGSSLDESGNEPSGDDELDNESDDVDSGDKP